MNTKAQQKKKPKIAPSNIQRVAPMVTSPTGEARLASVRYACGCYASSGCPPYCPTHNPESLQKKIDALPAWPWKPAQKDECIGWAHAAVVALISVLRAKDASADLYQALWAILNKYDGGPADSWGDDEALWIAARKALNKAESERQKGDQ
jgi:hypothetical protein